MSRRTDPNVAACDCKWFENAVRNEQMPVKYDAQMNEYHLVHKDGAGISMMYFCPFCGGRAPASLRATFWTEVSHDESFRLNELTNDILTPEQLFEVLGKPDHDFPVGGGMTTPGTEDSPPETRLAPRRVVYQHLSETADVHVSMDRYGRLKFSYRGRYIGPKRGRG